MITEDYVSFETAKLLKEKGFDEVCFKYALNGKIYNNGDFVICHRDDVEVGIPTLQMAMKWLREVHGVHVVPKFDFYGGNYTGRIYDGRRETASERDDYIAIVGHKTYNEAADAAIKYCLENLI